MQEYGLKKQKKSRSKMPRADEIATQVSYKRRRRLFLFQVSLSS